jgi:hypothetical protein
MWPEALDRVIDDVAREMTVGEPRRDLRAHVLARIDQDGTARLKASRSIRVVTATAAAVVVLAIVAYLTAVVRLKLDGADVVRKSDAVLKTDPVHAPAESRASVAQPFTPRLCSGCPERSRTGRVARANTSASPRAATSPSTIDDLPLAPIDVVPLGVDTLAAPPIDVSPLDPIAPIAVAPLGEGDRP